MEQIDCSPREIIQDACSLMEVRSKEKNLPLEVRFDELLPETIRTDPTRLRQILINVVGNAIKFTEKGSVQIITRLLTKPGREPELQINVIDTGIGIAEDGLENLFLPFTQADGSTTRKFGGTGLGLTISKRMAELLGGTISVTSTLGKGSEFSIVVSTGPLVKQSHVDDAKKLTLQNSETNSPKTSLGPIPNCRVLLAEDVIFNQQLISLILKKSGADVTIADNGQIAFDLAIDASRINRPFDVILMDMQMPVLDGYRATQQLRAAGYHRPIIALTAHAMNADRQKCLDAGCDDYATKPIDRKKLVELVIEYAIREVVPGEPVLAD